MNQYQPRFTHKLGDTFVTDTHTNERIEFKDSDAAYFACSTLEVASKPAARPSDKMSKRDEKRQAGVR